MWGTAAWGHAQGREPGGIHNLIQSMLPLGPSAVLGAPGGPLRVPGLTPSPGHLSFMELGPEPDALLGRSGAEGHSNVRSRGPKLVR